MLISLIERVREPVPKCLLGGVHRRGSHDFTHKDMQELIPYIQSLTTTQGAHAGEPFALLAWQKRFLRGAFKPGVHSAALSIARGAGKTSLCAAVATAALDGPLQQPRGEIVIVASSFAQARIAFDHVKAFLMPAINAAPGNWSVQDSANVAKIVHKPSGATLKAIGSDPRRAHGLAPVLVLADEPSQWESGKSDRMLAALQTSLGKSPNGRLIALGTKPASSDHWFSKWIAGSADYSQCHAATDKDKPFQKRTWVKANPSLPHMPHLLESYKADARQAKVDDSALQMFKSLRLNMGISDVRHAVVLNADTWRSCEVNSLPAPKCKSVWGIDLGSGNAMSAVSAFWADCGRLETIAAFPVIPSLEERGAKDNVGELYFKMHERGELVTVGSRVVDLAELLELAVAEFGVPERVVADRWRLAELEQSLDAVGLTNVPIEARGQGFKDGSEDVRFFRRAAIDGRIRTPVSLLMRSALSEARVVMDDAGNAKLSKKTEGGRRGLAKDDALASAILAVSSGVRTPPVKRERKRYHGLIPV